MRSTLIGLAASSFAIIGLAGCASATTPSAATVAPTIAPTSAPTASAPTAVPTDPPTAAPTAEPTPDLTTGQSNAIGSAQSYLGFEGFSRLGLIDQLTSSAEGYSLSDATFAVNSLSVDWNAEAVQSAKSYLQFSHFSCSGLIQQLDSSAVKFTVAQATFGAKGAGAC